MKTAGAHRLQAPATRLPREVGVEVPGGRLEGLWFIPERPRATLIVAHPSAIARLGWRERFIASELARAGFSTLSIDLLTEREDEERRGAHTDVPLLAERLLRASSWLDVRRFGVCGVGPCGAAALVLAAVEPRWVRAIVGRGGGPDLAGAAAYIARVPSLFLVSGEQSVQRATLGLAPYRGMEVVSCGLADDEALDQVTALSTAWFKRWLLRDAPDPSLRSLPTGPPTTAMASP